MITLVSQELGLWEGNQGCLEATRRILSKGVVLRVVERLSENCIDVTKIDPYKQTKLDKVEKMLCLSEQETIKLSDSELLYVMAEFFPYKRTSNVGSL